ncbi:MAG: hypothetical protein IT382_00985 [Deltaproteobacteria bacterium]|nr:hypothetical protein [Deltaproteobacteria bacterium]
MNAPALLVALVLAAPAPTPASPSTPAVRVLARPEIPWVVAVAAPLAPAQAEAERRALEEAGGSVRTETAGGVLLVVAEGPPEAEARVLAALRTLGRGAPLFVEGRVATTPSGALPAAPAPPPLPLRATPPESSAWFSLPLPWSPWLLDDEGEALRRAVARALEPLGAWQVKLLVDARGARLVLGAPEGRSVRADEVRAVLRALAERPAPPRVVEGLQAEAVAERARAEAKVGVAARRLALRARWFGGTPSAAALDPGTRLRAALVPEALSAAAATPAP